MEEIKTTKVVNTGWSFVKTEWFDCQNCKYELVLKDRGTKYCGGCGFLINWEESK